MKKVIIIDDEILSINSLKLILEKFTTGLKIVGHAQSIEAGIKLIEESKPDLVFLDIHLPDGNGFDLISKISNIQFDLIFITAFHEYAIKAFEVSAIYYILKPFEIDEVKKAVNLFFDKLYNYRLSKEQTNIFSQKMENKMTKIAVNSNSEITFFNIEDIVKIEADGAYSIIHLKNNKSIITSKNIGYYEDLLEEIFIRVHSKSLINVSHILKYIKGKGGSVIMSDSSEIEVSYRKKEDLLKLLNYTNLH